MKSLKTVTNMVHSTSLHFTSSLYRYRNDDLHDDKWDSVYISFFIINHQHYHYYYCFYCCYYHQGSTFFLFCSSSLHPTFFFHFIYLIPTIFHLFFFCGVQQPPEFTQSNYWLRLNFHASCHHYHHYHPTSSSAAPPPLLLSQSAQWNWSPRKRLVIPL